MALKFSPCIEMMFNQVDFYDRFKLVKDAGLSAAEFWGYADRDLGRVKAIIDELGMVVSSMCLGTRDKELADEYGKRMLLCEDSGDYMYKVVKESIENARALGVQKLIITAGQERNDITHAEQHSHIVRALKKAAPLFEDAGIIGVLEPLNILCNHRGYFLSSGYEAFGIISEVDSPNIKVLYDIYHQQITEGNLSDNITKFFKYIGHFHVADVPGRHEPGTGEINYRHIFKLIDGLGYDGYVGLEYSPTKDSAETVKQVLALV